MATTKERTADRQGVNESASQGTDDAEREAIAIMDRKIDDATCSGVTNDGIDVNESPRIENNTNR